MDYVNGTDDGGERLEAEEIDRASWDSMANWTQAERDYWFMGPFDGGLPGMIRRVRRILDVSQRGLAALLKVSQSVVARWETGRTSPRACVVEQLLRMARLRASVRDEQGEEVGPMRADGARTHAGSRYPAHVDLRATGWWVPRRLRSMTSVEAFAARDRSRRIGDPAIRYNASPFWKAVERELYGTPDDHPAVHQLAAESRYLDERREERFPPRAA
jgi:HTH-type transcriptional regulator/antitoxin HipB